jgi:hypothetical protein
MPEGWTACQAKIQAVRHGQAFRQGPGRSWAPAQAGDILGEGATLQTDSRALCDVFLRYNGPVLRLTPSTRVHFERLRFQPPVQDAGAVIETVISLEKGHIGGAVKKLEDRSIYRLKAAGNLYVVRGAMYELWANGWLWVTEGQIEVRTPEGGIHLAARGIPFDLFGAVSHY